MNIRESCPCGSELKLSRVNIDRYYDEQRAREILVAWRELHRHHSNDANKRSTYRAMVNP